MRRSTPGREAGSAPRAPHTPSTTTATTLTTGRTTTWTSTWQGTPPLETGLSPYSWGRREGAVALCALYAVGGDPFAMGSWILDSLKFLSRNCFVPIMS